MTMVVKVLLVLLGTLLVIGISMFAYSTFVAPLHEDEEYIDIVD